MNFSFGFYYCQCIFCTSTCAVLFYVIYKIMNLNKMPVDIQKKDTIVTMHFVQVGSTPHMMETKKNLIAGRTVFSDMYSSNRE